MKKYQGYTIINRETGEIEFYIDIIENGVSQPLEPPGGEKFRWGPEDIDIHHDTTARAILTDCINEHTANMTWLAFKFQAVIAWPSDQALCFEIEEDLIIDWATNEMCGAKLTRAAIQG